MCMILKDNDTDKHVAETDIVVYKVVYKVSNNKYMSILQKYAYEKDKVNNETIGTHIDTIEQLSKVEEGFHSYKCLEDAKAEYDTRKRRNPQLFLDIVIVKCVIPKGSTFYNGFQRIGISTPFNLSIGVKFFRSTIKADQYVSDKIVVKEEVQL